MSSQRPKVRAIAPYRKYVALDLCFSWSFNDVFYIETGITGWWNDKDLDGSGLIEVQQKHFPRGTKENHEKHLYGWSFGLVSNLTPLEYNPRTILLEQHVQCRDNKISFNREHFAYIHAFGAVRMCWFICVSCQFNVNGWHLSRDYRY